MSPLAGLLPEIILTGAGLLIMMGDCIWPHRDRLWLILAAASTLVSGIVAVLIGKNNILLFGMAVADPLSTSLKIILLGGVFIVILLSLDYAEFNGISMSVYTPTLLFSTVGLLLFVAATDLVLLLVALELLSIGSFVMTGYLPKQLRSSEAAIKFFLFGALSTSLLVFGISYYYGIFGNTQLSSLMNHAGDPVFPLLLSLVFILAGLGFKLAMVPFHMWVPDAYEGAPTPITAFLSVAPKAAALGVFLRWLPRHAEMGLSPILGILAALTMTVGNIGALRQTNIKRLLGYSSIAQVGYMLVGFVAAGPLGFSGALVYVGAYLFMNLGAFACVVAVSNSQGSDDLSAYDGISIKSLPLSLVFIVFLLSLTGMPPLFGFVGKFTIFAAALSSGWLWLATIGVTNSVISLYYYFRIARRMFFLAPSTSSELTLSPGLTMGLAMTLIITVGCGLAPNTIISWAHALFS